MKECTKYVGLDVHKATIAVAIAEAGPHRRFAGPCRKRRDHHGARGRQTPACSITSALVIRWFVT